MRFNVHAGHNPDGKIACGAVGLLKESTEARKVKEKVIYSLKKAGHTAYDCTVDDGTSQGDVLSKIVTKCNSHTVDLDISIHLNSGRNDYAGDGSVGGVEVLIYDDTVRQDAERVAKEISKKLGIRNRGVKINKSLYVLKNTKAKAMLIECCFVDDRDDVIRWDFERCAEAIVFGLVGQNVKDDYPHYRGHIQGIGWDAVKHEGELCGTTGRGLRLEALKIDYPNKKIYAKAHIQGKGDVDYGLINSNTIIGTVGEGKRLESLYLKGPVQFRVHIQKQGWTAWNSATNGIWLGTKGKGLRLEAIEIKKER